MWEFLSKGGFLLAVSCWFGFGFCLVMCIAQLHAMVDEEDRAYMDPVPPLPSPGR